MIHANITAITHFLEASITVPRMVLLSQLIVVRQKVSVSTKNI